MSWNLNKKSDALATGGTLTGQFTQEDVTTKTPRKTALTSSAPHARAFAEVGYTLSLIGDWSIFDSLDLTLLELSLQFFRDNRE